MRRTRTFMATLEAIQANQPPSSISIITNESIAFQKNDKFGSDLEAVIQKYHDLIKAGAKQAVIKKEKGLKKELEDIVFRRLGINMDLRVDLYLAATMPNVYIPHNPMINSDHRRFFEAYKSWGGQNKLNKLKDKANLGTVNTETVRVTGWFSEQITPVFMNFYELFHDFEMTVPEVTAILLHELGHDFNGILFSSNVNTTNQVIADIVKHIDDKDRGGDVKYVYSKIKGIYPNAPEDLAQGLVSGDKVVMNVAAYRLVVGVTETLMSESSYDRNSYEVLSDNFASRFGYGYFLITGLEKLEKLYPEYSRLQETHSAQVFIMVHTTVLMIAAAIGVFSGGSLSVLSAVLLFLFGWLTKFIFDFGTLTGQDMTYDKIKDRYTRIRNQLVEMLKDPELNVETKKTVLGQIELVDGVISQKQNFVGAIERFSIKFMPDSRRASENIALQQGIEKMLANDIFVSANRLAATEA